MSLFWIGAEAGPPPIQHRHLKLFKKSIFGGVPIGVDRDPAQLEIPQLLQVLSANVIGSRFRAYPHFVHMAWLNRIHLLQQDCPSRCRLDPILLY